jgi:hypothetical protein
MLRAQKAFRAMKEILQIDEHSHPGVGRSDGFAQIPSTAAVASPTIPERSDIT